MALSERETLIYKETEFEDDETETAEGMADLTLSDSVLCNTRS